MYVSSSVFSVNPAYPAQSRQASVGAGGIDPQTATDTVQFGGRFQRAANKVGTGLMGLGAGTALLSALGLLGMVGVETVAETLEGDH